MHTVCVCVCLLSVLIASSQLRLMQHSLRFAARLQQKAPTVCVCPAIHSEYRNLRNCHLDTDTALLGFRLFLAAHTSYAQRRIKHTLRVP